MIFNWHREDKVHKNVLIIYPDYDTMRAAFRIDEFLYEQIDEGRYMSYTKKIADVGHSSIMYTTLPNLETTSRGGSFDLIIAHCRLTNDEIVGVLQPSIQNNDGMIITIDGRIIK